MKILFPRIIIITLFGICVHSCATAPPQVAERVDQAQEYHGVLNLDALAHARAGIRAGDSLFLMPFQLLETQANDALDLIAPSVMDKVKIPPSGDKHDYTSLGPYWWPNPETSDSLPYIRKDGEVNPERNQFDKIPGATMAEAVTAFILMYYFTGDEKYAAKTSDFLKTWFINEATRMNPNMNFGQFIPGLSDGRSVGIIESRNFVFITEYESLLTASPHWTDDNHLQFKAWMTEFLDWLVTSDLGQQERARTNNHGSWCDFQLLALSQYCGNPEVGGEVAASILKNRLEKQFDEFGRQPEELARTKSYSYSVFNLSALVRSAIFAEIYGTDLSQQKGTASQLKLAIDYLIPFALDEKSWEYTQITGMNGSNRKMLLLLSYAQAKWPDERYENAIRSLRSRYPDSRYILTTSAFIRSQNEEKI